MRFTIERIRTLVLIAGVLLVAALVGFLAVGKWKRRFNLKEIPKRLGVNIQQEANGVTYTQARSGHTLFKIHASKVVQLKEGGKALLHDVQIELYGADGAQVDRIAGDEFEYDQKEGKAVAAGPVDIVLMRPGEGPAVTAKAPGHAAADPGKGGASSTAARVANQGTIHVKTGGLTFDQTTGIATTQQRVQFEIAQGSGSSVGATFDSASGRLVLDRSVELNVRRGADPVALRARHAEFVRGDLVCTMEGASADFRGGEATAGQARIEFREDGSATHLDATDGFTLRTANQARIGAPKAWLDFNERSQPSKGKLEGGASMDSTANGKVIHADSPTADLQFDSSGQLRKAHLERGVALHSEQTGEGKNGPTRSTRDWRSPVADVEFRTAAHGQVQPASVHGFGGVTISGQTQQGAGRPVPTQMVADDVVGTFDGSGNLSGIVGTGHARMDQTTAAGARQSVAGDRVTVALAGSGVDKGSRPRASAGSQASGTLSESEVRSATVDGNVVLTQESPAKAGSPGPASMRATAGKAVYEGAGEWLHLTVAPRVESGGLQLTADRVDVAQSSGDAFAHGNVKATWVPQREGSAAGAGGEVSLGGKGPAHVIASEAQLHNATGEATFKGQARLWQDSTSVSAPVIVLDRTRQTLVAHGAGAGEPVNLVLLSNGGLGAPGAEKSQKNAASRPSVVRVRGADLKYSGAEHKAVVRGGPGGVVADTGSARITASEIDLDLAPSGKDVGGKNGGAEVDHVTAVGNVDLVADNRRGHGDRLVYWGEKGEYVLTGSAGAPPTITETGRGTVTGDSLIFTTRDDSVRIEGDGSKTSTQTIAPK